MKTKLKVYFFDQSNTQTNIQNCNTLIFKYVNMTILTQQAKLNAALICIL